MVSKIKSSKNDTTVPKRLIYKIKSTSLKKKILLLIILAVVSFVSYRQTTIYLEKRDILAKQQKLEELADKIASQYPPDSRINEQYCEYSHQKFSKGDLSCSTTLTLNYQNITADQATKIKDDSLSSLELNARESTYPKMEVKYFKYNPDLNKWSSFISDLNVGSRCSMGYYYDLNNSDKDLEIILNCWREASFELFPVRK